MKLAIALDGSSVSGHFGQCGAYALFNVNDGSVSRLPDLANPGHEPGFLPRYLAEHGVTAVVAGGMGPRAVDLFCQNGIEVFLGISGPVDEVAAAYAAGNLTSGTSTCTHDTEEHENCEGGCH